MYSFGRHAVACVALLLLSLDVAETFLPPTFLPAGVLAGGRHARARVVTRWRANAADEDGDSNLDGAKSDGLKRDLLRRCAVCDRGKL